MLIEVLDLLFDKRFKWSNVNECINQNFRRERNRKTIDLMEMTIELMKQ